MKFHSFLGKTVSFRGELCVCVSIYSAAVIRGFSLATGNIKDFRCVRNSILIDLNHVEKRLLHLKKVVHDNSVKIRGL